jgi:hypothetical protein
VSYFAAISASSSMHLKPNSTETARDSGIDSLRGLMLLGMAMNHITSRLQVLTDHPFGYTSSAEGFVFLSGLVAGLVYTRRRQKLGVVVATRASVARACTIYCYHIGLFAALLIWTNAFTFLAGKIPGNAPQAMLDHPIQSLIAGLGLVNQPPLLDILPMYAGFMLLLPTVLAAFDAGHYRRVLAVSMAVWALTNLVSSPVPFVHGTIQVGAFTLGAWQLLFMIGVVFGHAKARGKSLLPRWTRHLVAPAFLLCGYAFLIRHWYLPAPFPTFADWVNKNNLAPARLINTGALIFLVHLAFVRWPGHFLWPPLALLGRHSLAVFSTHVATAYVLYAFPGIVSATPARTWLGTAIMVSALYAVALWRESRRTQAIRRPPARIKTAALGPSRG